MTEPKDATSVTEEIKRAAVLKYAMNDRTDFMDAERGLIAELPEKMYTKDGQLMRDGSLTSYITDDAPCPDTVNPALWRQSLPTISTDGDAYSRLADGAGVLTASGSSASSA